MLNYVNAMIPAETGEAPGGIGGPAGPPDEIGGIDSSFLRAFLLLQPDTFSTEGTIFETLITDVGGSVILGVNEETLA